ncbi:MAG: hypothetical protein KBF32_12895, partial [Chitinophagales bacterium]|nr:hypothetical protein [Chitinophagales bacterium]
MPKINAINHMACNSPGIFIRVFLLLCISAHSAYSQQNPGVVSRIVYLAGNTADAENTKNLEALRESVLKETAPVTVIYNG